MKRLNSYFDMHYNGIPQSQLSIPGGNDWTFPKDNEWGAMIFNMVHTAHEYKMTPSDFFQLPSSDKALMMAYINVKNKMAAAVSGTQRKSLKNK